MQAIKRSVEGNLRMLEIVTAHDDVLDIRQRGDRCVIITCHDDAAGVTTNAVLDQGEVAALIKWLNKE